PVSKVFQAFLDPAAVKQWFGPYAFSIGEVILDARVNGVLEIEMIAPNGQTLWVKGAYTEIVPLQRIGYTFSYVPDMPGLGETLVTTHFLARDQETEVTIIHTIYKTINPEGRAKGWVDGFAKMEQLLDNKHK
ncbi:MAG: SRPBCC domain-containing protein, partial [Taibaiella sp.]|nr:SRPBCC domain-containing protein [Taibaiella sp.]